MTRVDFSANARVYDDGHGAPVADDLVRRLIAAVGMPAVRASSTSAPGPDAPPSHLRRAAAA